MAQVDSKVAGKPYKRKAKGRTSPDGSEAVIKLETLQTRMQDLVALKIKAGQSAKEYTEAVKAVAEATGLLSVTVNKIVRAKAGNSFVEDKMKAQQLALVFEECGEFDEAPGATAQQSASDDDDDEDPAPPLSNEPEPNPIEKRARRGNGRAAGASVE